MDQDRRDFLQDSARLGAFALTSAAPWRIDRALAQSGFSELPVTAAHAARVAGLPRIHRDPFDRLLVAEVLEERLAIVTHDRFIAGLYEIEGAGPSRASLDKCNHCYHSAAMAQLVVRKIEESVVARLRRRAARHGISLEEEHRRILRAALLPAVGTEATTLKEYLMEMPQGGDDAVFERPAATLRRVRL